MFASPLDLNDSNIPNGKPFTFQINYIQLQMIKYGLKEMVLKKSFHQVLNSYYSQMFSFIKTLDICDNSYHSHSVEHPSLLGKYSFIYKEYLELQHLFAIK